MDPEKDQLNEIASDFFGINYIYPYQRLVISNILTAAENDSESIPNQVVILPTGYGKSLCYMLPSLLLDKPTIVMSPLLSLIKDQERRLQKAGIKVSTLSGSLSREEKLKSIEDIRSGRSRILLTSPESLYPAASSLMPSHGSSAAAADSPAGTACRSKDSAASFISHLVVDEAHTIPEWGETFREALMKTGEIIEMIKPDCVTAFTATATSSVFEKIIKYIFGESKVNVIAGNPDRSNIFYSVIPSLCPDRDTAVISKNCEKPLIIFCSSRTDTEMTSRMLRTELCNNEIFFYHAGLEKSEKDAVEKWFFSSKDGILVSTCAYGMGIDKPDIRTVLHRNPPQSVEAYLQESGRAGRDGQRSDAILLHSAGQQAAHHLQACGLLQARNLRLSRAAQMIDYAENSSICRREKLLSFFTDDIPVCSGCDICSGNQIKSAAGKAEIIKLIKENSRKLTGDDITDILRGFTGNNSDGIWNILSESFSALSDWRPDEISETLDTLVKTGEVRKGRFFWKNFYSA